MAYITATEVTGNGGEFTWPSGWDSDAKKNAEIARAQERIDQVTRDHWEPSTRTLYLSGDATNTLITRKVLRWPIISVTNVYHRSVYAASDNFEAAGELIDEDDYMISDSRRALIRVAPTTVRGGADGVQPIWLAGYHNYRVVGSFGRATTPEGIKLACILLTRELVKPGSSKKYVSFISEKWPDGYEYRRTGSDTRGSSRPILTGYPAVDDILYPFVLKIPVMGSPG